MCIGLALVFGYGILYSLDHGHIEGTIAGGSCRAHDMAVNLETQGPRTQVLCCIGAPRLHAFLGRMFRCLSLVTTLSDLYDA